ncbi:hypothetical protein GCM10023175_50510 [Pseudonocardia xishanensis]|uniref:Uncharacterized protein n=1 Tax=Pseudonocardia xishanensis TaxID=630995 RepID=A0ABP8RYT7_9PSEU
MLRPGQPPPAAPFAAYMLLKRKCGLLALASPVLVLAAVVLLGGLAVLLVNDWNAVAGTQSSTACEAEHAARGEVVLCDANRRII